MTKGPSHSRETHGFHHFIAARKIGDSGLLHAVEANEQVRLHVAQYLGVVAVDRMTGSFKITRWRARGLKLAGELTATVVQSCVVTLEPVREEISCQFERRFLPAEMLEPAGEDGEVFVDPEGEDPPESLTSEIDLGEILVEELALNLNPYPRKPGVSFEEAAGAHPEGEAKLAKDNPFAALARLKGQIKPKTPG